MEEGVELILGCEDQERRAVGEEPDHVMNYAHDIAAVAKTFFPQYSPKVYYATLVGVMLATGYCSKEISDHIGPVAHKVSGGLAFVVNRVVDIGISMKVAKEMEDPRFKEYGLDKVYYEMSPLLKKSPRVKDYLKSELLLLNVALGALAFTFAPNLGYGLGAGTPQTYLNNRNIRKQIILSKNMGDAVKSRIREGDSRPNILSFLSSLKNDEKTLDAYFR